MVKLLKNLIKNESGATAIEYALIAGLIAIVAILAMGNVGNNLTQTFNNVAANLNH